MAVVGASVIAGVVFVFVPRGVGLGRMGDFGRAVTGRTTGFSDRVELGQGGLISQSQERVMEVKIGYRGSSVGTEGAVRYLRGAVLERYSGGVWTKVDPFERPSERRRVDMTESEQFIRAPEYEFAIKQEVTLFGAGAGETPLFAVYKPHSLAFQEYGAMEVAFDATAATLTRRGPAGRLRYSIDSYPDRADRAAVSSRRMAAYLASREQVGFPSEAIRAMAAQVLIERQIEPDPAKRPAEEDLAAARALRAHVERHATYTLDILAAPQGQDPTEWFLFQVRKGHCEYFASALAALCRSVGIDARVVTGFVAGEFDRQGEVYVVRAANAHAWVEARVGADHWITLDGTPASEIERISSPTGTFGGRFWRWLDGVESVWASSVVSFDTRAQQQLLGRGMKSPWLDSALEWTRERLDGGGGGGGGGLRVDFGRLGTGLALLVGGGAIVWVALRRRGPRAAGWRGVGMDAEAQVVHGALLAALARRGHPKPSHAPLRAHAAGIEDATLSREAVAIADRLYAAVFGGRALDAGESREWARRARALEREG
jgi:transglutaminase-like putative cysteine protease